MTQPTLAVGCVPQGTHAVGWSCRENKERVRAYRTHPTMQATACYATTDELWFALNLKGN